MFKELDKQLFYDLLHEHKANFKQSRIYWRKLLNAKPKVKTSCKTDFFMQVHREE